MAEKKYTNNIRRGVPDKTISEGEGPVIRTNLESPQGWSGIGHRVSWEYVTGPNVMLDAPHYHDYEELIIIQGSNPADPRDFDAEIELTLGEEGEKHIITGTTLLCLPKGLVHGPLKFTRVGKTIVFVVYTMATEYEAKPAKITGNATPHRRYEIRQVR
jgi:hypothetical protein